MGESKRRVCYLGTMVGARGPVCDFLKSRIESWAILGFIGGLRHYRPEDKNSVGVSRQNESLGSTRRTRRGDHDGVNCWRRRADIAKRRR